jgi:hypothetical protein
VGNGVKLVVVPTANTAVVADGATKEGVENLDSCGRGAEVNN